MKLPAFLFAACLLVGLCYAPAVAADNEPEFLSWAPTPPMGWNSWDCFAATVNEQQTRANADVMAAKLKDFGWQYVVVDIQWYEPGATGFNYRVGAPLVMDEHGRLQPAVNRFPSSKDGAGFKPLADYVHGLGLKFGVHIMRGVPRLAVERKLPVKGTDVTAADIANTNSTCTWNSDMYGVDMSKPGAQAYYNSVFDLFAEWGVDYVKIDDISRPYENNLAEIEAVRRAIDQTGRPMVLSLSPGETSIDQGEHVERHANLWRISDDFWDHWPLLFDQFRRLDAWTPYRGPGHWPDADMLPIGALRQVSRSPREHKSKFTQDEQYTLMNLWAIARSPLMMGGDLAQLDPFTESLLTNRAMIAVNQHSTNNRQLFRRGDKVAWVADAPDSTDKYLALFNTGKEATEVGATFEELGLPAAVGVTDLWDADGDATTHEKAFEIELPSHGSGLYRLSPGK